MSFTESISTVFSKYATSDGRASRSEYWWFGLFYVLVSLAASFIDELLWSGTTFGLESIVSLALAIPSICVAIRRCHDSNHSGWWVICPIVNIVFMFFPSDPCVNDYGSLNE